MRIWITAAVLVTFAALGLAVVPYAVNWEQFRWDIQEAAEKATGLDITINGPIDVILIPRPVLSARDVTITDGTEGGTSFQLTSQQIDLGMRPAPLMVGRPIVDRLKLMRPTLALDQDASDDIKSWPPKFNDWTDLFFQPDLRLVSVNDGRLTLTDRQRVQSDAISDVTFNLSITDPEGMIEAAGLFKTSDHRFTVSASVGEQSRDGSSTVKLRLDTQNGVDELTTLNVNGVLRRKAPEAGLAGRFDLAGPDLRASLKAISTVIDYPPTFLSLAPNQAFKMQSKVQATATSLKTEDARITLNDKLGRGQIELEFSPSPKLDLSLDLPTVRLADDTTLANFLPLDLLSALPTTPGHIDLGVRELLYRSKAIRRAVVKIRTDKEGTQHIKQAKALLPGLLDLRFDGIVRPSRTGRRLSGKMAAAGDNLREALHWFDWQVEDQGSGWRSLSLESDVHVSNVEMALRDIDMRLDASKITGNASLRFSERLNLDLDLDVERLDLDLYTAEARPIEFTKFLVGQLDLLDASIDTRFQRLAWQGLRLDEATLKASARDRRFALEQLAIKTVGETAVNLEGDIDLEAETVDLTSDLQSAFPTRVLRHLDIGIPLTAARLKPLVISGWVAGKLDNFDVGLRADYDNGPWQLEGQAGWIEDQAHYNLRLLAEHPDHRALAGHFGLAPLIPANDAIGPFELELQLQNDPQGSWASSGNAKLGPTSLTGRLDYRTEGIWDAKLSVGNPRKDSLAPFLATLGLRSAGDWTPSSLLGRLPTTGLRTAWLDDINGTLSLAAKGGLADNGVDVSARLMDGFLYVDKAHGSLWNGDIQAELSLEKRRDQPFAAIAIKLQEIDAEPLFKWLDMPRTIEGPLTVEFDATTVGNNAHDIAKALSGKLHLEAGTGKLHSIGIPDFRRAIQNQFAGGPDAVTRPDDPLAMPFDRLELTSNIHRGILTLERGNLILDAGLDTKAEASIQGTLDLLLWIAELQLSVTAADASEKPMVAKIVGSPARPQGLILAP